MAHTGTRTCIGALMLGVLAIATPACSGSAFHPATLQELPPKDPPASTPQPGETGDPGTGATPSSPTELEITCAVVEVGLPDGWEGRQDSSGEWLFELPKGTGGGSVRIDGSFTPGAKEKSSSELEAMVRGKGGAKAPVQPGADGGLVSRLVVARGNEWRLAKSFPEKGTQLVSFRYSPASAASDPEVEETSDLLHEVAANATIADPGGCDQ
jgi:hypothetical protein